MPRSVNTTTQVPWERRFWLFICLLSFLCALGIFTESQFYAYTIGIHGTYAYIIYYVVGVTLSSAIQVLLIQPGCCKAFLEKYQGCLILKSCGQYLVMFTVCFLSSGTGLPYLGLSSDGKAPSPVVARASAPYRSQAFSEIAGLLASALLTVNALSIIILLRPAEHNTFFGVAAGLTMESAIGFLYKYPSLTIVAAVFILAMTLLKDFLCRDKAAGSLPAEPAGSLPLSTSSLRAAGSSHLPAGSLPLSASSLRAAGSSPLPAGSLWAAGSFLVGSLWEVGSAAGSLLLGYLRAAGSLPLPAGSLPAGSLPLLEGSLRAGPPRDKAVRNRKDKQHAGEDKEATPNKSSRDKVGRDRRDKDKQHTGEDKGATPNKSSRDKAACDRKDKQHIGENKEAARDRKDKQHAGEDKEATRDKSPRDKAARNRKDKQHAGEDKEVTRDKSPRDKAARDRKDKQHAGEDKEAARDRKDKQHAGEDKEAARDKSPRDKAARDRKDKHVGEDKEAARDKSSRDKAARDRKDKQHAGEDKEAARDKSPRDKAARDRKDKQHAGEDKE